MLSFPFPFPFKYSTFSQKSLLTHPLSPITPRFLFYRSLPNSWRMLSTSNVFSSPPALLVTLSNLTLPLQRSLMTSLLNSRVCTWSSYSSISLLHLTVLISLLLKPLHVLGLSLPASLTSLTAYSMPAPGKVAVKCSPCPLGSFIVPAVFYLYLIPR